MCAGGGVSKQHLHITRAYVLRAHFVGGPRIPRDPADDLQIVAVVKRRRSQSLAIINMQRHFRKVPRRPCRGPGKDHIFHAAAAHRCRTIFTHHPPQGLKQIRLPTAIRADDTR